MSDAVNDRQVMMKVTFFVVVALLATELAFAQQPEIATAVSFTEGPTVDREGNVYFSEMVSLRIMKLSASGQLSTFREHSNNANGLLIDPEGRLVACEGADSTRTGVLVKLKPQVTRTDLGTGKIEVLADNYQGKPFVWPNDVTIDGKGRLYFSAYDLGADGTVSRMRVHYNFYPGRSGDGMSIDTQGNLYVSAGMNQLRGTSETLDTRAGVYVISPAGKLLNFIPIAEDFITNNAFGGPDMKTLYVTAGKTLYRIRTDIAGLQR